MAIEAIDLFDVEFIKSNKIYIFNNKLFEKKMNF
jgi:hypothetical protein